MRDLPHLKNDNTDFAQIRGGKRCWYEHNALLCICPMILNFSSSGDQFEKAEGKSMGSLFPPLSPPRLPMKRRKARVNMKGRVL